MFKIILSVPNNIVPPREGKADYLNSSYYLSTIPSSEMNTVPVNNVYMETVFVWLFDFIRLNSLRTPTNHRVES